jgi:hypothetical protein
MTTGPTPAQVAAQVAMVRRHRPEDRVIGMHTPGGWLGGATLQVNGKSCNVIYCSSGLQVREALASLKAPHPTPLTEGRASPCADAVAPEGKEAAAEPLLVVMTPLDEAQLGLDVLARFGWAAVIPYRSLANGARPLSCSRGRPTSPVAGMARRGTVAACPRGGVSTGCQRLAGCRYGLEAPPRAMP